VAAADLAAAGLGTLHVLDDRPVDDGDLAAVRFFVDSDAGAPRAAALASALGRLSPSCAVEGGPLRVAAGEPLALAETRWDLVLAAVPADDLLVLQAVARFAHAAGLPSLSASLDGLEAVIGPGVVPGRTACWECARLRTLAASRRAAADLALQEALLAARPAPRLRTCLDPAPALVGHLLALAAIDLLADPEAAPLRGRVLVHHLVTLESARHGVLPMPWCEVCGGAAAAHPDGAPPGGNGRDLDRARDAEELLRMLEGVVDARTGIVPRVIVRPADASTDPEMPFTATAMLSRGRQHGCCHHDHGPARESEHGHGHGHEHESDGEPELGAGKGTTLLKAMISAVGEAVERRSAGEFDPWALRRAPAAELTEDFIPPAELSLYAEHQYAEPGFPCARPDPRVPLDWVRGRWLDTGEAVLVPALPVYMNYPVAPAAYFTEVTSSGLSAGPTLAAAYLGAALELIERDAFMISWLARRPGQRVRLDDSVGAAAREAGRQLEERGVRVELYHLDVGLGIPTIVGAGYGDGVRWPGVTVSLSAHLSPRVAIEKALLELGHIAPYLRRLVLDEKRPIPRTPEEVVTLDDHALYYVPAERAGAFAFLGAGGVVDAAALPEPEEIAMPALVARVQEAGLRIAVVDVTSPDLAETPFRVARAVGPRFQQIHFGHGRAHLGNPRLLALAPDGINPDPHPLA
jgi:ribosomal protein S12 methylthiotransferase accessory factor